jgi:hypothetical protein
MMEGIMFARGRIRSPALGAATGCEFSGSRIRAANTAGPCVEDSGQPNRRAGRGLPVDNAPEDWSLARRLPIGPGGSPHGRASAVRNTSEQAMGSCL